MKYINPCNLFVSTFIEFVFPSSLWGFVFVGLFVYEKKDSGRKLNFYDAFVLGLLFQVLLQIYFGLFHFGALSLLSCWRSMYTNAASVESLECSMCSYCGFRFWQYTFFVTYRLNFFFPSSDPVVKLILCTIQIQLDYNRNHYSNSRVVPAFQWHLNWKEN